MVSLLAPAKINLSLRLLQKRQDGYHELESLMAPLALADEIELRHAEGAPSGSIELLCNDPSLPTGDDNLCVKAARTFQEASGLKEPVVITLLKKIPHGAGLGGGSSDAAAILRGMNTLFKEPFVVEELHQLAAALGSDIPFFLEPKPSWCRGRGELLTPAAPLPDWKLLLVKPPFAIATAWAYSRWEAQGGSSEEQETIDGISIVNDLETPVFKKYHQLPVLKSWLQARSAVLAAWMTGSGSTLVAALPRETDSAVIESLKKEIVAEFGSTFWVTETTFA